MRSIWKRNGSTSIRGSSGRSVAVAVSGGVDSSVAALLLKERGLRVTGIFITIRNPAHIPCTSSDDRRHAMRACAAIGIPFLDLDATDAYRERVIRPLIDAYRRGETPNPDVSCNSAVKFGAIARLLLEKGFDRIATGHYARVRRVDGETRLFRSVDEEKDQTYFIHATPSDLLDCALFPVGGYTKRRVRSLASRVRLPAAEKKDSVGLCFLGDVGMKDFLSAYLPVKRGDVRRTDGEVIGEHDGAWFYTIGQRHGFRAASTLPQVVVRKDMRDNVLVVADTPETAAKREFLLADPVIRRLPQAALVARYRHRGALCPVSVTSNGAAVVFDRPQVVAPGQSVVLYTEDGECLGGGAARG